MNADALATTGSETFLLHARPKRSGWLYLVSALFMLSGCFLICLPWPWRFRPVGEVLSLLAVLQLYEAMVVAACLYLGRRMGAERETMLLVLVETIFLFDGSFTAQICGYELFAAMHPVKSAILMGGLAALALVKMELIDRAAPSPVFGSLRRTLTPLILFLYSIQGAFLAVKFAAPETREWVGFLAWGTLGLLYLIPRSEPLDDEPDSGSRPLESPGFHRIVLGLAAGLTLAQLTALTITHCVPFQRVCLLPISLGLLALAPALLRHPDENKTNIVRYLGAVTLIAIACGADAGRYDPLAVESWLGALTPLRIGLFIAAASFAVLWFRERFVGQFDAFCLLLTLGGLWRTNNVSGLTEYWQHPDAAGVVLALTAGILWAWHYRSYFRTIAVAGVGLVLALRYAQAQLPYFSIPMEFFRGWPALALAFLLLTHRPKMFIMHCWSAILVAAVFVWGVYSAWPGPNASPIYMLTAGLLLFLAGFQFHRFYRWSVPVYLLAAILAAEKTSPPQTAEEWGLVSIVLAFVLFLLAFWLTRRHQAAPRLGPIPPHPDILDDATG